MSDFRCKYEYSSVIVSYYMPLLLWFPIIHRYYLSVKVVEADLLDYYFLTNFVFGFNIKTEEMGRIGPSRPQISIRKRKKTSPEAK